MKVYGVEVIDCHIEKLFNEVISKPHDFTLTYLDISIQRMGYPKYIGKGNQVKNLSNRIADRILQKWKRDGYIEYKRGMWRVI